MYVNSYNCSNLIGNCDHKIDIAFPFVFLSVISDQDQEGEDGDCFPPADEIPLSEDEQFRKRMESMESQGRKSRTASITEIRAHAFDKLQEELMKAQEVCKIERISKCAHLSPTADGYEATAR